MIVLESVSKQYDGGRYAVRDVSLRVADGQMLVLLGGSGCGKTTTLKMINRLIEPTSGRIEVDGRGRPRRRSGGAAPRHRLRLPGHRPVSAPDHRRERRRGAAAARLAGRHASTQRVDELLDMVHLPPEEYRDRLPRQLSGGQQQRVGFARALAAGPQVMLLDEPFGALDPVTRDELRGEFLQLRRRLGLTAVMVTHDMTEALLSADLIAVMNAGRLLQVGTPHELLTKPGR